MYSRRGMALREYTAFCINNTILSLSRCINYDSPERFEGGVVDTGAQKPVIGISQARACCRLVSVTLKITPSQAIFVFGDRKVRSLGLLNIMIPTLAGPKLVTTFVVNARIPFLIGLDIIDKHGWNVQTVENELRSVSENWSMPLTMEQGHVFVCWKHEFVAYNSRQQLQNMHMHFMHPSTAKLLNLLLRAYPDQVRTDTRRIHTRRNREGMSRISNVL